MPQLIRRFQPRFRVARIVSNFAPGALGNLANFFDIVLVQNIDSIRLMSEGRYKMISRMGGTRTFDLAGTPFNEELKQVGAIIATNERLFEMGRQSNDNVFLIPNGIDLQLFQPRPQRQQPYDDGGGSFIAGFAGNIEGKMCMDYKGWYYYVQATLRMYPQVESKSLLFHLNQIPHDRMPEEFYHKIDCLILPSIDEGCSNVVVEALACGVPVLLTKVGFHGEYLRNGVNCLFIKRDIDDIMSKVKLLMETEELRMKLAFEGRLFAEMHHNINEMAHEYNRIFEIILKRKAKGD